MAVSFCKRGVFMKRVSFFLSFFAVVFLVFAVVPARADLADSIRRFLDVRNAGELRTTSAIGEAYNIGTATDPLYAILSGVAFGTSGAGIEEDESVDLESATGLPYWGVSSWGECESECGSGIMTRVVTCRTVADGVVDDSLCDESARPNDVMSCFGDCSSITQPSEVLSKTEYSSKSGYSNWNCTFVPGAMGFVSSCNSGCFSLSGTYLLNMDLSAPPTGYHYRVSTTFRTMRNAGMDFRLYINGSQVARSYTSVGNYDDWAADKTFPISVVHAGAITSVRVSVYDVVEWPACVYPVEVWIERD